jgi:DNA-directed RNA polymerase subunit N (RpoN/RPB10)
MIIPIRCFTCGKVIAHLWETYIKMIKERESEIKTEKFTLNDITISEDEKDPMRFFDKHALSLGKGEIMDKLGIERMCCRRHFLSHVDLIDII